MDFENLDYEAFKFVMNKILLEDKIRLKIYIKDVIVLKHKQDIKKIISQYHSSRVLGGHVEVSRLEKKIK